MINILRVARRLSVMRWQQKRYTRNYGCIPFTLLHDNNVLCFSFYSLGQHFIGSNMKCPFFLFHKWLWGLTLRLKHQNCSCKVFSSSKISSVSDSFVATFLCWNLCCYTRICLGGLCDCRIACYSGFYEVGKCFLRSYSGLFIVGWFKYLLLIHWRIFLGV